MVKKRCVNIMLPFLIGILIFTSHINVNYAAAMNEVKASSFLLSGFVPFLSLLLLIGGSIILTLSYVAWRKYKGNKLKKNTKKQNPNN